MLGSLCSQSACVFQSCVGHCQEENWAYGEKASNPSAQAVRVVCVCTLALLQLGVNGASISMRSDSFFSQYWDLLGLAGLRFEADRKELHTGSRPGFSMSKQAHPSKLPGGTS